MMPARAGERGSASIWVLACGGLVIMVGTAGVLRTEAVLGRHRAESAADLSALAAAGQIGRSEGICAAARTVAAANSARLATCVPDLAADGRSGSVRVRVTVAVRLPVVGTRTVVASARAGREPAGGP